MHPLKLAIAAGPLTALVLIAAPASATTAAHKAHQHQFASCGEAGTYL